MDWTDQAIILAARKHGEGSAIVDLLTSQKGRHVGLVRGASGPRMRGILQPGNSVQAIWRARLPEHLGTYTIELAEARAAQMMDQHHAVLALSSLCSVACMVLPEREQHNDVYEATGHVFDLLANEEADACGTGQAVARWEFGLLGALGYGLDLSACAVTGETDNLNYVSPKSGRAVSEAGAGDYVSRLLALPDFLNGGTRTKVGMADVLDGLTLTGHFLEHSVLHLQGQILPPARNRYLQYLVDLAPTSGG
ncbi:MAG: DNA repair protein RecO [Alphaproteobacteria bacterium]|nr:MAG: DNA repair protein RecO [Alphaproteobacteria bacterium]